MNSILNQETMTEATAVVEKKPSEFQERIFHETQSTDNNILVQAVAGSGKSTTLAWTVRRTIGSRLCLAFNKSAADELQSKIGSEATCKTLNALGHRVVMTNRPRAKLDADKLKKIAKQIIPSEEYGDWSYATLRAVSLAKANAIFQADSSLFKQIIDDYLDVPVDMVGRVAGWSARILDRSLLEQDTFDFDDQLALPILNNWAFPSFDNIFVDEAQDLSPIQHAMLERLYGRVFAFGDRRQAIYAFRGAAHDSMDRIQQRFKMIELPLSISYRCPQAVVQLAQKYCPQIQSREGAPNGQVLYRKDIMDPETQQAHYSDPPLYTQELVLCRTNAPLFKAILRHIRAKEPCRVLSNFLESFQSTIKTLVKHRKGGWQLASSKEALQALDRWFEREMEEVVSASKAAYLEDKYETIKLILDLYPTVAEAVDMVRRLANSNSGPTFATIHKAKGLESPMVYVIRPDLMPSPWASGESELIQEDNMSYVAITRALDTLTFGIEERRR